VSVCASESQHLGAKELLCMRADWAAAGQKQMLGRCLRSKFCAAGTQRMADSSFFDHSSKPERMAKETAGGCPHIVAAAVGLACLSIAACVATEHHPTKETSRTEDVATVSVCQLISDPARYNHKLIQVTGTVDHGFEGFFLSDTACSRSGDAVWLEYGGKKGSGTVFAGGPSSERKRSDSLELEGVSTSLIEDSKFERLDHLIQSKKNTSASATIIGRYFSGERIDYPAGSFWGGYGHLGGFTLLVIQQVAAVRPK
jgi:hypothetical protein